jgi:hypothetical protein
MPNHEATAKSSQSMETSKSRVHVFRGQDLAAPILTWLKRPKRRKSDRVEALVRLESERSKFFPGASVGDDPSERIAQLVNDTMRVWGFGLVHTATATLHDWTVDWKPKLSRRAGPDEQLAFHNCCLLKRQGLLDRIRQCGRPGCGEWFFAKFDHQNFHSEDCRKAELSADEARKEKRREHMREWRATSKKIKEARMRKKGGNKS